MAAAAMTYDTAQKTKCGAGLRHGMALWHLQPVHLHDPRHDRRDPQGTHRTRFPFTRRRAESSMGSRNQGQPPRFTSIAAIQRCFNNSIIIFYIIIIIIVVITIIIDVVIIIIVINVWLVICSDRLGGCLR